MLIEITTFRLAAEVAERRFLDADERAQVEFFYQQSGLVRRTTARGSHGEWLVLMLWGSQAHAEASAEASKDHPATRDLMALADAETYQVVRYTTLD